MIPIAAVAIEVCTHERAQAPPGLAGAAAHRGD